MGQRWEGTLEGQLASMITMNQRSEGITEGR